MGKLTQAQIDELTAAAAKHSLTVPPGLRVGLTSTEFTDWVGRAWRWIWDNRHAVWLVIKKIGDALLGNKRNAEDG